MLFTTATLFSKEQPFNMNLLLSYIQPLNFRWTMEESRVAWTHDLQHEKQQKEGNPDLAEMIKRRSLHSSQMAQQLMYNKPWAIFQWGQQFGIRELLLTLYGQYLCCLFQVFFLSLSTCCFCHLWSFLLLFCHVLKGWRPFGKPDFELEWSSCFTWDLLRHWELNCWQYLGIFSQKELSRKTLFLTRSSDCS